MYVSGELSNRLTNLLYCDNRFSGISFKKKQNPFTNNIKYKLVTKYAAKILENLFLNKKKMSKIFLNSILAWENCNEGKSLSSWKILNG